MNKEKSTADSIIIPRRPGPVDPITYTTADYPTACLPTDGTVPRRLYQYITVSESPTVFVSYFVIECKPAHRDFHVVCILVA